MRRLVASSCRAKLGVLLGFCLSLLGAAGPAHAGIIAYWRFDELGGTTAFDSVGSVNGTLNGGAMFAPSAGILGGAIQLSPATNDFVDMGNNFGFGGSAPFSIQAWVKLNPGDTAAMVPVAKHFATIVSGYFLAVNDTGDGLGAAALNKAHFWESGAFTGPSSTTVNDGQWHQLVGVYDGTLAQIYVDGAFQNSVSGAAVNPNSVSFLVGGVFVSGSPVNLFRGLVDEVQLYDNALSATEVQQLYRSFVPAAVPEPSSLLLFAIGGMILTGQKWRRWKV